jgi:hypothetical protein
MPAIGILGLYRLRWQIELLFKRLKSLLHLDALPSREGPTAKSWMLARLIAAALAQRLVPENLERLCNSRRERELEGHELNQQTALFY